MKTNVNFISTLARLALALLGCFCIFATASVTDVTMVAAASTTQATSNHNGTDEPLKRQLLAGFTENGSTLEINMAASETLAIVSNGANYTLTSSNNWNGTDSANVTGNGTTSLTVTADAFNLIDISDSGAGVSVTFNDSAANSYSDAFTITLDDGAASPGLIFNGTSSFGNNAFSANIDANILLNSSASLATVNGGITLQANQAGTTTGNFKGLFINGGTIETTGTGNISLTGFGADNGNLNGSQIGVHIQNGSTIRSTASGADAGTITINGTGGSGINYNYGVHINGSTTTVTSVDGNVQITAQGGSGSGFFNRGMLVNSNAQITSTGMGANAADIVINAIGGTGGTHSAYGFDLDGSASQITSIDGDIQLTGQGGSGSENQHYGIFLDTSSQVVSSGVGAITLNGTGGTGTNNLHGTLVSSSSIIEVANGMLTISGNAGTGGGGDGVRLNGGSLLSSGTGAIQITGDSGVTNNGLRVNSGEIGGDSATANMTLIIDRIHLQGGELDSDGTLTIQPLTASTTIGLGNSSSGTLNLDDTEIGFLQDGFSSITIGDATTGDVDINSVTFLDPVTIIGGTINDNNGTDITAPEVTLDGNVAPGQSPGQLLISGDLSFTSAQTLTLELNGTTAGTNYDQVSVTGAVDLNNVVLTGTLGFTPTNGDNFIIIENDDVDAVDGTFNGLAEGAMITIGDYQFTVTYVGGDGNDVVLQNATPLAVTLALFEAQADNDSVLIRWQTVSEVDNLGFNLYRATESDRSFEQIKLNSSLIPAQAPGSGQGTEYEWIDTTVEMGKSYYYWLEDVDVNQVGTSHGPISTTATIPTAITTTQLTNNTAHSSLLWVLLPLGLFLASSYWHKRQA